jgi:hypothetical protein
MTRAYLLKLVNSKKSVNEKHGKAYDLMELYYCIPQKKIANSNRQIHR